MDLLRNELEVWARADEANSPKVIRKPLLSSILIVLSFELLLDVFFKVKVCSQGLCDAYVKPGTIWFAKLSGGRNRNASALNLRCSFRGFPHPNQITMVLIAQKTGTFPTFARKTISQ